MSAAIIKESNWTIAADIPSDMRVAILFFGMIRNVRHTLPSIESALFRRVRQLDPNFDVFAHTLAVAQLTNRRSGERGVPVNASDVYQLRPAAAQIEEQRHVDRRFKGWSNRIRDRSQDTNSVTNVYRSKYSLYKVSQLLVRHERNAGVRYDPVVVARPDVRYILPVPLPDGFPAATVAVPDFHHWSGVNDRFAIGSRDTMVNVYATQIRAMEAGRGMGNVANSEEFLCNHLRRHNVTVVMLPRMRVVRVRADGVEKTSDASAPHAVPRCSKFVRS